MFSTLAIRTAYSAHLIRAHRQGFEPLPFISFIRAASNAVAM